MSRHMLLTWLMTAVVGISTAPAWAQIQQGGGGGGFGNTGIGGSGAGGGFGNSAFGTSSFGGSLGSSGFGSGNFGSTGLGSGFGTGGSGAGGFGSQGIGQSTGAAAQGGQSFVGRDGGDMQQLFNQIGRGSNQFFQQLNRTMGGRGQNRNRQNGQEDNAELPIRVQLNVAFDHPRPQSTALAATVRSRLDRVLAGRDMGRPQVEVDGDTVILRGTATSESQRLVIEKLVSLEPGVSQVDNRLTVADAIPSEPSLPARDN